MPVMEKVKIFAVEEPIVAVSCLIAGVGALHLPLPSRCCKAHVRLFESSQQIPQPALSDVVTSVTGKKQG